MSLTSLASWVARRQVQEIASEPLDFDFKNVYLNLQQYITFSNFSFCFQKLQLAYLYPETL